MLWNTLCRLLFHTRQKSVLWNTSAIGLCVSPRTPNPPTPQPSAHSEIKSVRQPRKNRAAAHSKNSIQQKQPAHWTIINDCPMCGFKSVKNASFLHRTAIPGKLISEYVKQMSSSCSIVNSLLVLYGLYLSSIIRYCFSERKFVSFIGNVHGWYSI